MYADDEVAEEISISKAQKGTRPFLAVFVVPGEKGDPKGNSKVEFTADLQGFRDQVW